MGRDTGKHLRTDARADAWTFSSGGIQPKGNPMTRPTRVLLCVCLAVLSAPPGEATNGHFLHGVGSENQSLGGAGAAHAVDAVSALTWNPASGVALDPEVSLGVEWFVPDRTLESRIDAGALGPGLPFFQGSTRSDTNSAFLPTLGVALRSEDSDLTWLVAISGVAGFGVEYELETPVAPGSNPLLTPQPPRGFGFGEIQSEYQLLTLAGGLAWEMDEHWSLGVALVAAQSRLEIKPAPFAAPDDADGDGFPTYPQADELERAFGGGFRIGLRYAPTPDLSFGAAYASPLWFEDFEWSARDELGRRRRIELALDLPAYWNAGFSYRLRPTTRTHVDVRWIDYEHTDGFDHHGFGPDGAVRGFGWDSIWVFAAGIEQDLGERVRLRLGYNYGENPIPAELSFFNTPSPAIVKHHLTSGASLKVSDALWLHLGYYHAFENRSSGPFVTPLGEARGTRVRNELSEDSFSLAFTVEL